MSIHLDIINGVSLGLEYIPQNEEAGVENACVILDLALIRLIFEFHNE